jgi:7-cyano-7-deazaguanine synthase
LNSRSPAPPAVVLLSGGLDSTTVLAIAKSEGFSVHALTFRYGQRHSVEIEAAKAIARGSGVATHRVVDIDLTMFGGSALTADIPVPKDRDLAISSPSAKEIPVTYVPARNTIFLSHALALAEVVGAANIFIGVNALDYSGYPDCRPEYIQAFERMANLATRAGVEGHTRLTIRTPLISLTKAAIIRLGTSLGVDYGATTSCYDPSAGGEACGRCDACQLRLKGFSEAGLEDPIRYASKRERATVAASRTAGRLAQ